MSETPPYLQPPPTTGRLYGTVDYDAELEAYEVRGEPMVIEMAKRLFPGSRAFKGVVRFPATRRLLAELNWLMLRYPLTIKCQDRYEEDRHKAIEHAARRNQNEKIRPIRTLPPTFLGKPYDFQREAVAFLLANERCLLADDMGLGKTVSALAAAARAEEYPVLIVVQPHLRKQWRSMIGAFMDVPPLEEPPKGTTLQAKLRQANLKGDDAEERADRMVHVIKGKTPYDLPSKPFYVIHYGLLDAWKDVILELNPPIIIFDEIQELRHANTAKYSAASDFASNPRYVWGLSGTPIHNHGIEMWSVMNIIDYHCLGDMESFTKEWCTGYLGYSVENPTLLGQYLREEGLMLRRRKEEVQSQLPPKRRIVQRIDSDDDKYAQLAERAIALAHGYENVKDWHLRGQLKRIIEEEARSACGEAKAPFVAEFVRSLVDAGESVLLCAHHHKVHDILMEHLEDEPYNAVKITGKETEAQKQASKESFQKGESKVLILALRSASGLDGLQGIGSCVVFAELDWSPAVHCLDGHSEILTRTGFHGHDEVHVGDEVAAFDLETEAIRWVPVLEKADRLAGPDERFYRVATKQIDLVVTGQHRMVYRRQRRTSLGSTRSPWAIDTAASLAGTKRRFVPTAGYETTNGVPLTDDELRLIGLWLADGSFNGRTLSIHQAAHQPWNLDIRRILDGCGLAWSIFTRKSHGTVMHMYNIGRGIRPRWTGKEVAILEHGRAEGMTHAAIAEQVGRTAQAVHIKWSKMSRGQATAIVHETEKLGWDHLAPYLDKDLSFLFEDVTTEQLDCLLYGFWLGDGSKTNDAILRFTNINKTLLDRLQSLCVRHGKTARISKRKRKTTAGNAVYDLFVGDYTEAYLQDGADRAGRFRADQDSATGQRVWCVRNEMGTIVVRRNGKVAIVGNSQAEDRLHRMGMRTEMESLLCYYLVSSGIDETMQEALGLKVGQFVGVMGDKAPTPEDAMLAQQAAGRHLEGIIDALKKHPKPKGAFTPQQCTHCRDGIFTQATYGAKVGDKPYCLKCHVDLLAGRIKAKVEA